ncbi:AzlC family ABC transporter permease [Chthonobacter rhizosphaerae]|uniref:AzlC family ABC transporter permease n=1 Tax=Chthonobacter rhizosphaerae TaxID=2735553 RepID=UPI0015EF172A|nr:AzlC family ABC transporter permease [Chthonobacter rhizosphaerae]
MLAPPSPSSDARAGLADVLPATLAVIPFALLLGGQAAQKGLSALDMLAMSSIVFAGGSQFLAVGLWTDPAPWAALALAAFLINLRHVLMGASLARKLDRFPAWQRFAGAHLMTDETWALAERRALDRPLTPAYWFAAGALLFVNWQIWTVLGVLLGGLVAEPERYGFDFAFPAVFIALALGFWKGWRTGPVIAASALTAVAVHALVPGAWYVIAGALAGIAAAVLTTPADAPAPAPAPAEETAP